MAGAPATLRRATPLATHPSSQALSRWRCARHAARQAATQPCRQPFSVLRADSCLLPGCQVLAGHTFCCHRGMSATLPRCSRPTSASGPPALPLWLPADGIQPERGSRAGHLSLRVRGDCREVSGQLSSGAGEPAAPHPAGEATRWLVAGTAVYCRGWLCSWRPNGLASGLNGPQAAVLAGSGTGGVIPQGHPLGGLPA
jgi:hypothetical protein